MKAIYCTECDELYSLQYKRFRRCKCGETAGKYMDDLRTAVVTKGAIIVGIDNFSFYNALKDVYHITKEKGEDARTRFFNGWIPSHPGQCIFVDTPQQVKYFKRKI